MSNQKEKRFYCNICDKFFDMFENCSEGLVQCMYCRGVTRHRAVVKWLKESIPKKERLMGLEVGGDGIFLDSVVYRVFTIDREQIDVNVVGIVENLPFYEFSFDVVVALDVLEHVKEDTVAVAEMARIIKPSGRIVATASMWADHGLSKTPIEAGLPQYHIGLSGQWDCFCHRYYTKESLKRLFLEQNLAIEEISINDETMAINDEWILIAKR